VVHRPLSGAWRRRGTEGERRASQRAFESCLVVKPEALLMTHTSRQSHSLATTRSPPPLAFNQQQLYCLLRFCAIPNVQCMTLRRAPGLSARSRRSAILERPFRHSASHPLELSSPRPVLGNQPGHSLTGYAGTPGQGARRSPQQSLSYIVHFLP
jgi:hypothetical protein